MVPNPDLNRGFQISSLARYHFAIWETDYQSVHP